MRNGWLMPTIFFLFWQPVFCQETAFTTAFKFIGNFDTVELSNNPYKLLTGCFIEKTLNNTIIYGYTKADKNCIVNRLDPKNNTTQQTVANLEELKGKITPKVYDDLSYYGISEIAEADNFMAINTSNTLLIFRKNGSTYAFQKEITVNDSIEFNQVFPISDSTFILLDYKAKFTEHNDIKAYCLNIYTNNTTLIFRKKMSSNVACYDRTNTRYYDSNKSYFLITDNLDYSVHLFDSKMDELSAYTKKLNISDESRKILNPKALRANTHDSVMKELNMTPRIVNTQFLNDSEIVVNYAINKTIEKDGLKIKSSIVDILVIRNKTLVFKRTLDDTFVYQKSNFESTGKQSQKTFNPYLRGALPAFLFVNNQLIQFNMDAAIPRSNMSYSKYIQKAKGSILNLKSKLIYSDYEYLN
jgi:hypothetical protein